MWQYVLASCLIVMAYGSEAAALTIEEVKFKSQSTLLAGSLVLPQSAPIDAAIVFVHGSGPQTRNLSLAEYFAKQGIATLVYDKRGVGESAGEYEGNQSVSEKNINTLAIDAIAALSVLRKHTKTQSVPLGLTGISQAGWIVPIAAQKSGHADFMVIWSGPVCKVSEEDIYSKYTRDLDGDTVPSYEEALSSRRDPYIWPDFLGKDSNPVDTLSLLTIPGLWIFGAKDGSVPVDLSITRLSRLIANQHEYDYVLLPDAGHNNIPESIDMAIEWMKLL